MLKLNERQAKEFVAELAAKCDQRWKRPSIRPASWTSCEKVSSRRKPSNFLQKLGLLRAGDQLGLHLGFLQAPLVFRQKRRPDGSLHGKSSRRVRPSLPAGAYSDPDQHRRGIGTDQRRSATLTDAAGMPRAARFSSHADQRRPDSGVLVLGLLGASFWQFCLDFFNALTTHYGLTTGASELFFQASRSRHHGSSGPKGPWRGHPDGLSHGCFKKELSSGRATRRSIAP